MNGVAGWSKTKRAKVSKSEPRAKFAGEKKQADPAGELNCEFCHSFIPNGARERRFHRSHQLAVS